MPVRLPADKKYHIVSYRPIITPGNEYLVHHMVLYGCPTVHPNNQTYECGMAPIDCSEVIIAWSIGQGGTAWSGDFALPFGAGIMEYVYLQMHYNNPSMVKNLRDSSGLELVYTPTLREHDIGLLVLAGNIRGLNIPARSTYTQKLECPSQCTQHMKKPVTIVNYFPHMHMIGKKMWVQHIRDGVELPELHRDDNYDFQRQQNYPMNLTFLPGDRLITHCVWDASSRAFNTTGGESSSQEMCVALFQYYPAIDLLDRCTDFGGARPGFAACGNSSTLMSIPPSPSYVPLPPRVSTCPDREDESAGSVLLPLLYVILIVVACVFV